MIVGAGGSLGSELCDSLSKDNNIIAVDISENSLAYLCRVHSIPSNQIYIEDIRNFTKIKAIIDYNKVDIIINCAALKHVMWCEYNIKHAIEVNVIANLELINYMRKNGKKFIFISSDKAANPQNVYALTKQFTDYIVKLYDFKLVRGVNFINSKGSVLDVWEEQRKNKKAFTIVDNIECNRFFIPISQMADIVKEAVYDTSNNTEYIPKSVYRIYINDLFKSFLKMHNILNYQIEKISLSSKEKVSEDLDFNTNIIEIRDLDKISDLLKNEFKV
jgi:FlaA1/EpsC-like NDP-sugar epimerase